MSFIYSSEHQCWKPEKPLPQVLEKSHCNHGNTERNHTSFIPESIPSVSMKWNTEIIRSEPTQIWEQVISQRQKTIQMDEKCSVDFTGSCC